MIQPKEIIVKEKKFIITKFPATVGREIASKYIPSAMPGNVDYKTNEEMMYKMMNYAYVVIEGNKNPLQLSTQALVDNHVTDWEMLAELEIQIMEYNCSFFQNGRLSNLLKDIAQTSPQ